MSQGFTDDKSTLVQVMARCHQAASHYLNQCWPRSKPPYGAVRPQWVNVKEWYRTKYITKFIHNNLVHKEKLTGNLLYIVKYCKSTVLLCGDEFLFQTFVIFPPFSQNLITWPNYISVITSFCCVDLIEESILNDLGHQPMDGLYGVLATETTEQNIIHYSRIKDWISYLIHNWFCTFRYKIFLWLPYN